MKPGDPGYPVPTSEAARRVMLGNRSRDTKPEVRLRSALHRMGLRFRKHRLVDPSVRARPDVIFASVRVAVFVDGCFWHCCPAHGHSPRGNSDYWSGKLARNVDRDRRTDALLAAKGWTVIRVWEHEDVGQAAERIARVVQRSSPIG